jgi:hypothetical protein
MVSGAASWLTGAENNHLSRSRLRHDIWNSSVADEMGRAGRAALAAAVPARQPAEGMTMGDVIRKMASTDDIFEDVASTMLRARARGGKWQALAEMYFADMADLVQTTRTRQQAANDQFAAAQATAEAAANTADLIIGRVADEIWNAMGRPANDPTLSLLFPGGIKYYIKARREDQPDRMRLLVSLLGSNLHSKLDPTVAKAAADAIAQAAENLRATLDPARLARVEARLLDRTATSVARSGQIALANLKRRYKAEGFSEAEIHAVIPDHPRATRPTANPSPTPPQPVPIPVPSLAAIPSTSALPQAGNAASAPAAQ